MFVRIQLAVAAVGLLLIAIFAIYLPWNHTWKIGEKHFQESAGYHFIFNPPGPTGFRGNEWYPSIVHVDATRAAMPMIAVIVLTVAGVLVTRLVASTKRV